jgi:GNAT superfamily N-acetyltransferase
MKTLKKLTIDYFPGVKMVEVDRSNLPDAMQLFYKLFSYDNGDHISWSLDRAEGLAGPYVDKDHPERDQIHRQRTWMLQKDGKYVGMVAIKELVGFEGKEAWIDWAATLPSHYSSGLGKLGADFIYDLAKKEGYQTMRCWSTSEGEYRLAALLLMQKGFRREIHPEDHQKAPGTPYNYVVFSTNLQGKDVKERREGVTLYKDVPVPPRKPYLPPGAADWTPDMDEDAFPESPSKFPRGFIPRYLYVSRDGKDVVGYWNPKKKGDQPPEKKEGIPMLAEDFFRSRIKGLAEDKDTFIPRYLYVREDGQIVGYWSPKSEDDKPPFIKAEDGKKYLPVYTEVYLDSVVTGLARTRNIRMYGNNEPKVEIAPLSWENLKKAERVARRVFPEDNTQSLALSLLHQDGKIPDAVRQQVDVSDVRYWLATYEGKPAGIIGLYKYKGHEGEAWVGWHGVDEQYRGRNIGHHLLHYVKETAKKEGVHTLRSWSVDDKASEHANEVYYPKQGFVKEEDPTAKYPGHKVIVHSLNLENPGQKPRQMWADVPNKPRDLTGHAYPEKFEQLVVSSGLAETLRATMAAHNVARTGETKAHQRSRASRVK